MGPSVSMLRFRCDLRLRILAPLGRSISAQAPQRVDLEHSWSGWGLLGREVAEGNRPRRGEGGEGEGPDVAEGVGPNRQGVVPTEAEVSDLAREAQVS